MLKILVLVKKYHITLSRETLEGLYMTGMYYIYNGPNINPNIVHSFVDLTKFLLEKHKDGNLFLLSGRLSQDPLENYFGKQRAGGGGRNDNPTVKMCIQNASALTFQKSHALNPVRGNCHQKRLLEESVTDLDDLLPLPKCKHFNCNKSISS